MHIGSKWWYSAAKAEFAGTITPTAGPITILIPKQQVGQLTSTIGRSNNGQVVVLVDEARVAVIDPANGWRLQFAMLDGRYPDWRVIPVVTERWSSLEVEREQLISSLERAKILSDSRLNAVSLNLAGGEISVSSQGVDGIEGAIEIISCTQKNRNGSIKFNVSYLINAVQSLVGSRVHMFMDLELEIRPLIQSPDDAIIFTYLHPFVRKYHALALSGTTLRSFYRIQGAKIMFQPFFCAILRNRLAWNFNMQFLLLGNWLR